MSMAICSYCGGFVDTDADPAACIDDRFFCESCRSDLSLDEEEAWQAQEAAANRIHTAGVMRLWDTLRGKK